MNGLVPERERRVKARFACNGVQAQVRALAGTALVVAGTVRDISTSGIGLILKKAIPSNKPFIVELFDKTKSSWNHYMAWAVHCTKESDDRWLVGCSFLQTFNEDHFASFLDNMKPC